MMLSLYLAVAGRSPQGHATLPTRRKMHSTTPYWLLQSTTKYYSVLQGTTPELLCTTTYYASTNPYYKV